MKPPGTKWMIFICFSIALGMMLTAYFQGTFTFSMLLERLDHYFELTHEH